jgi:uncharacterized protein (DUF305 family)
MKLKPIFAGVLLGFTLTASAQMAVDIISSGTKFMQDMDVSMKKMDHDMSAAPMNGIVDHNFVTMMIPHHQGAIDMAKGELSYGKDPVMRRLAQEIIVDQQSEIDLMNLWLKKHANDKAGNEN